MDEEEIKRFKKGLEALLAEPDPYATQPDAYSSDLSKEVIDPYNMAPYKSDPYTQHIDPYNSPLDPYNQPVDPYNDNGGIEVHDPYGDDLYDDSDPYGSDSYDDHDSSDDD